MAKLKVFATRIGFHDAVVAAPNQKAALAAWDIRENLFTQGAADVTEDVQAVKAALAEPGVVLRRAAGTLDPFKAAPDPPRPPKLDDRQKAARGAAKTAAKPPPPPPPKPDRKPLDAAEKALADFDKQAVRRREALERDLRNERRALDRERDRVSRVYQQAGGES